MKKIEDVIKNLTPKPGEEDCHHLDRCVAREIGYHVGKANSVRREQLLDALNRKPGLPHVSDRKMRESISYLRSLGLRICHFERDESLFNERSRQVYGYYMAANDAEYNEFRSRYISHATSIWDNIRAMDEEKALEEGKRNLTVPPQERATQSSFL